MLRPTVIIDTREQAPFTFNTLTSERGTLDTGDYSVRGLEHLVALERKSPEDLLGCIANGRDRFVRELQRLRAYRFRCLVVEVSYRELAAGRWRSKVHPNSVLGSIAAWCARYELPVMLCDDHKYAGEFAERFLFQAARTVALECQAVAGFSGEAIKGKVT